MPSFRAAALVISALVLPSLVFASGFDTPLTALRGTSSTPLPDAINAVATAFLVLTTTLALIVIVLAGVQYMLSQGDEEKVETAKKTLVGAVMGLLVIGLSGAGVNCVLNMINGKGCGGGGGSASVAVRPPAPQMLVAPDDVRFGGSLPVDDKPPLPILRQQAAQQCKPYQTCSEMCLDLGSGGRVACSAKFNVLNPFKTASAVCCLGAINIAQEACGIFCNADPFENRINLKSGEDAFNLVTMNGLILCELGGPVLRSQLERHLGEVGKKALSRTIVKDLEKIFGKDWRQKRGEVCSFLELSYEVAALNHYYATAVIYRQAMRALDCPYTPRPLCPRGEDYKTNPPPVRRIYR